jgi:hypothetical protein
MLVSYLRNWFKMNKKGLALDYLGWLIIAAVVLVLVVIGFIMIKGKQESGLAYIKDLWRWS